MNVNPQGKIIKGKGHAITPTIGASVISSNGITWTFDQAYATGTFVTGDPWVVAPSGLTVTSVSPGWTGDTNGSMVNPSASTTTQGYDNRSGLGFPYSSGDRVTFPLAMSINQSLISTIGKGTPTSAGGATHVNRAAVLTVLASNPGATAFRPPYVGSTKTIYTTGQVNYAALPGLSLPSGCSLIDTSSSSRYLNRLWLDHGNAPIWVSQIFPELHSSATGSYNNDRVLELHQMAMLVLVDDAATVSIANRLIQYGIDQFPNAAGNGRTWAHNGGHGHGRKWPILFAKLMLGQSWSIPYYVTGSSGELKFQEDSYTWDDGGTDRWGEDCVTTGAPSGPGSNHACRATSTDQWEVTNSGQYDAIVSHTYVGFALSARLLEPSLGIQTAWAHTPFFDYTDRFVNTLCNAMSVDGLFTLADSSQIDFQKYGGNFNQFMTRMWEDYR